MMFKTYKKQLIISSLVIVLPVLVGLVLWNALPDRFATHWTFTGEADGWSGKAFAIFLIPLSMLATHWLCFWLTTLDPKAKGQSRKAFNLIFWIMPCASLFASGITYAIALGAEFNINAILFSGLGLMFICIGNYLPKCRQNHTMGIKVPWALANEENWNATHRFGGKVWVIGGFLMLPLVLVPTGWAIAIMMLLVAVLTLVPTFYSWRYYKKQQLRGVAYEIPPVDETNRKITRAAWIITALILVFVAFFLFSGNIDYLYGDDSFTIEASFWNDLTVDYAEITDIELRNENIDGSRVWGLGSFRLLLGAFENEEFGNYTRYTYFDPDACVVLTFGDKILVLSGADAEETAAIYEMLTSKVSR